MPFGFGSGGIHDDNFHAGSAKRNTASGVKGIDATSNLFPKAVMADIDPGILNVASGIVGLTAANKIASSLILKDAVVDTNGDIPHMRPKAASANLRHSHDAQLNEPPLAVYTKIKTITFANGISGTLRIAFDLQSSNGADFCYGKIYKNGVAVGAEQSTNNAVFQTKSQDINIGALAAGGTIELWAKTDVDDCAYRNFRISYDNAADTILVAGVTNS